MINLIKKIVGKIAYLKRKIAVFYWRKDFSVNEGPDHKLLFYKEIESINNLSLSHLTEEQKEMYQQRFFNNNLCCVIENEGVVAAYGWVNTNNHHYLGELDLMMNVGNGIEVLYDFYTDVDYRGQGLYPYLLKKICLRNNKSKLIYAFAENNSSIKGIKKANFRYLGNLRGINKIKYKYLIKKICKE